MLILDQVTNKNVFGSVYPRWMKLILSLIHTIQVYISTLVTPYLRLQLSQPLTPLQHLSFDSSTLLYICKPLKLGLLLICISLIEWVKLGILHYLSVYHLFQVLLGPTEVQQLTMSFTFKCCAHFKLQIMYFSILLTILRCGMVCCLTFHLQFFSINSGSY